MSPVWVIKGKRVELDSLKSKSCGQRSFVEGISQSLDSSLSEGYEIFEEAWPKSKNKEKDCYRYQEGC